MTHHQEHAGQSREDLSAGWPVRRSANGSEPRLAVDLDPVAVRIVELERPISCRTSDHALELFGPGRLMYGGDWPFTLLASRNYRQVWDGIQGSIEVLDGEDRRALLGDTARRVYGLTDSG